MAANGTLLRQQRQELFATLVRAYTERNFATIEEGLRPDVVVHVPGFSPFAGEHHGVEAVARLVLGIRQFLDPREAAVVYSHEGDEMVASLEAVVHGPKHVVDMLLKLTLRFHEDGRVAAVYVQPSDVGLFDHVISSALLDTALEP